MYALPQGCLNKLVMSTYSSTLRPPRGGRVGWGRARVRKVSARARERASKRANEQRAMRRAPPAAPRRPPCQRRRARTFAGSWCTSASSRRRHKKPLLRTVVSAVSHVSETSTIKPKKYIPGCARRDRVHECGGSLQSTADASRGAARASDTALIPVHHRLGGGVHMTP